MLFPMLATRARSAVPKHFIFFILQHYLNLYSLVHTQRRFFVKFFLISVNATLFAMPAMRAMSKSLCVLAVVAQPDELLPRVQRTLTKP